MLAERNAIHNSNGVGLHPRAYHPGLASFYLTAVIQYVNTFLAVIRVQIVYRKQHSLTWQRGTNIVPHIMAHVVTLADVAVTTVSQTGRGEHKILQLTTLGERRLSQLGIKLWRGKNAVRSPHALVVYTRTSQRTTITIIITADSTTTITITYWKSSGRSKLFTNMKSDTCRFRCSVTFNTFWSSYMLAKWWTIRRVNPCIINYNHTRTIL